MASYLAREPKRLSDVLRFHHPDYSVDGGMAPAGTVLEFGTPMAADASGNPVAWAPGASDSTATITGLSSVHLDAQATPVRINWIARHAIVVRNSIEWPAGITVAQQTAALAALKALGIVARQGE